MISFLIDWYHLYVGHSNATRNYCLIKVLPLLDKVFKLFVPQRTPKYDNLIIYILLCIQKQEFNRKLHGTNLILTF